MYRKLCLDKDSEIKQLTYQNDEFRSRRDDFLVLEEELKVTKQEVLRLYDHPQYGCKICLSIQVFYDYNNF